MHLEIPAFGQQKNPIKSGFLRNISFLCSYYGGGRWIRTTEVSDNRFTVCPLWPLGNSPIYGILFVVKMEPVKGVEPPTC